MKNLSETISTEQLIEDFYVVVADAEALLKATADQGGEKIAKLRAKAEASLSTVKERMADAQTAVVSKTRAAGLATEVYVHENPWNAIGVGAGIGLLLGWIMGVDSRHVYTGVRHPPRPVGLPERFGSDVRGHRSDTT